MAGAYRLAAIVAALALTAAAQGDAQPGLTVQMGEAWIFHVENGQPAGARKAAEGDKPGEGEFRISLGSSLGTTMTIVNNSPTAYNYHAFVTSRRGGKGSRTSVCTLMNNGRMAFENWPQAIPAIRVADFTPAKDDEMGCR